MTIKEKQELCINFFYKLADELKDTHEVVGSCNKDSSVYLIPKGSIDKLTYHSKPENSYRFSDHWNWYANIKKCEDSRYVQCFCPDLPWTRRRPAEGMPSRPVTGICVAYFGTDNRYHSVFGDRFDRKTRQWSFVQEVSA